jgi:hypothetical protein
MNRGRTDPFGAETTDQREEQIDAKKRVVNSSRTDQSARDRNGKNKRKKMHRTYLNQTHSKTRP